MSPWSLSRRCLQAQPDERLVTLARDGHEAAFEALVSRYRTELLAYCRRLQPEAGSAEDALQQALLQAWRALTAGAEVRTFRPWLYRIAHNVTLNDLRAAVAVAHEVPDKAGGPELEQLVEQRFRARAALAEVASLPSLQRQAFISTTLDGASQAEVASALGLSSGAVRGLIYRARATLRSAAAAFTPGPVINWAIRRTEARGAPAVPGTLAGGGAGVAATLAKGGAALTLAGAVAGTGGLLGSHVAPHQSQPIRSPRPTAIQPTSRRRGPILTAALTPVRFSSGTRAKAADPPARSDRAPSGDGWPSAGRGGGVGHQPDDTNRRLGLGPGGDAAGHGSDRRGESGSSRESENHASPAGTAEGGNRATGSSTGASASEVGSRDSSPWSGASATAADGGSGAAPQADPRAEPASARTPAERGPGQPNSWDGGSAGTAETMAAAGR